MGDPVEVPFYLIVAYYSTFMKRLQILLFLKVKPYIWVKRFLRGGGAG